MLPGVMSCKDVSGLEHFLTYNARMRHVQVNLSMSLYLGFVRIGFATLDALVLAIFSSQNHGIHNCIQL